MRWIRIACFCMCVVQLAPVVAADANSKQWLAFAPQELAEPLKPLAKRRQDQGWKTTIVDWNGTAAELLSEITARAKSFEGRTAVVLCGAYGATKDDARLQPLRGTKGRMLDSPTDHGFGLPDAHGVATIEVGRLPARTADELKGMIEKIVRFEDQAIGPWSNRLNLIVADPGGASAIERQFAEVIVQSALGSRIRSLHARWRTTCIADATNSPFAVGAGEFGKATTSMFNDGQLFACYCGHSGAAGLWSRRDYVMVRDEFSKLAIKNSSGVFVSCGCFGCQVSGLAGQGYVLSSVQNPNGPVAAVGAFGESYAALGQLALDGLMDTLNQGKQPETLGEYWLGIQRGLAHGKISGLTFWLYDQADGTGGKSPLADQRQEHMEMWTLLGDPALRMPLLGDAPIEVQGELQSGESVLIEMPARDFADGTGAAISVEYRFGQPADKQAVLFQQTVAVTNGLVKASFAIPSFDDKRDVTLRVIVADKNHRVQGAALVKSKAKAK